ncbi:MAG: septal ring lytic transglycosylase RlpA family protein [Candidatus Thiodiazotropha sp. (ex Monitilora ramsayi)]|nr:septal ring lytic transglycosylase RlpA family protein [Candidatus Thiodiazotropha sp. (ex Monitilora ramsayi)]
MLVLLIVSACSSRPITTQRDGVSRHLPPPKDIASIPDALPKTEPLSSYGNPDSYVVFGKRYYTLKEARGYSERGIASWYGSKFHGRRTSSGEPYDMYAMTAAHKSLPLPSYARITNLKNNRSIVVKVNDRGPFHDNRLIDLSYTAAWKLGIIGEGTGLVEVITIDPTAPDPVAAPIPTNTNPPILKGLPELFLQVGAFGSPTNADRLKQRIEEQLQVSVLIEKTINSTNPVFRVQIGPIASVELADHLTQRLDSMGIGNPHVVIR